MMFGGVDDLADLSEQHRGQGGRLQGLSDSRGIGIQLFVAFQSVAQIIARRGEDDGRRILADLTSTAPPTAATDTRSTHVADAVTDRSHRPTVFIPGTPQSRGDGR